MNHWQLLSLTPDADERSIKRAYARLLKTHRPDENPDEFQRLREAYEASLAEARWRAQADEEVVEAPIAVSAPTPECPQPAEVSPLAIPLERLDITPAISPPEPSMGQMQQWLAEGKDRQLVDALRVWMASDWLIPFERRQQFEQSTGLARIRPAMVASLLRWRVQGHGVGRGPGHPSLRVLALGQTDPTVRGASHGGDRTRRSGQIRRR